MFNEISLAINCLCFEGIYRYKPTDQGEEFEDIVFYVEPILEGLKCDYTIYPDTIIIWE